MADGKSLLRHLRGRCSVYLLTTLGAVALSRIVAGGLPVRVLGPGKLSSLVAHLTCRSARRARSDELVELLWSDRDSATGHHDLRQAIWQLRRHLGRGAIECEHGDVVLSAQVNVDRDEFVGAVEQGALERAVNTYGGEFLPGVVGRGVRGFEEWAELERYRLRRMFYRTAEALVRQWLATGRFAGALELAKQVRDAHPDDQPSCRLHIEALLRSGEWGRAASEADVLEWRLAVSRREPDPATREVLRRVRESVES